MRQGRVRAHQLQKLLNYFLGLVPLVRHSRPPFLRHYGGSNQWRHSTRHVGQESHHRLAFTAKLHGRETLVNLDIVIGQNGINWDVPDQLDIPSQAQWKSAHLN